MTTPILSVLRDRAKSRSDMVNASFVSDTEWNVFINNAGAELFEMIVQGDQNALQKTFDITAIPNTQIYSLPTDFAKLTAVYWMDADKPTYPLRRASMHEFGYQQGVEIVFVTGRPYAYNILSQQIWLFPLPNISGKVRVIYYPDYTALVADGDSFSWPVQISWIIDVTAAIAALTKEESDTQQLQLRKMELVAAIKKSVATKDSFQAITVRDRWGVTSRHRRTRLQV
jgi:hypothetical protein